MDKRLTEQERRALLDKWISPATEAEADRQERAERMVKQAIHAHPPFAGLDLKVEAKGSYRNNTNVRADADVDIKVQLNRPVHADFLQFVNPLRRQTLLGDPYDGPWRPGKLRQEVFAALDNYFAGPIDADHNIAFNIPAVPGSRPSIDVVPCFRYLLYSGFNCDRCDEGSIVYPRDGKEIVNWPDQQLSNGRAKNNRTNRRYKFVVRVLKAVENELAAQGVIKPLPSYFSECLIYNVPDDRLAGGTFDDAVRESLAYLARELHWWFGDSGRAMVEPNGIKKVFGPGQKWTIDDARTLVNSALTYLNYR
ncbi:hypothetical protein [Kitasatospora sp. NPDC051914]|uniref:hypothetical protein n=1 Tax=Kitasatospora sp. NPDC051914 TaxID=3154945 RepID=UPI003430428C